jgi:hypothetical protein
VVFRGFRGESGVNDTVVPATAVSISVADPDHFYADPDPTFEKTDPDISFIHFRDISFVTRIVRNFAKSRRNFMALFSSKSLQIGPNYILKSF